MTKSRGVLSKNSGKCIYTGSGHIGGSRSAKELSRSSSTCESNYRTCLRAFQFRSCVRRTILQTVIAHIGDHPALAWRLVEGGNIDRALARRPALEEKLLAEMGVDEGGRPVIAPNQRRIDAVLQKLAAGLYFARFGQAPGLRSFAPLALYDLDNPPEQVAELSWGFQHIDPMTIVQCLCSITGFAIMQIGLTLLSVTSIFMTLYSR